MLVDMSSDSLVSSYWGVLPFGAKKIMKRPRGYNSTMDQETAVGKILKRTSVGSAEIPSAECLPDSFSQPYQPSLTPL